MWHQINMDPTPDTIIRNIRYCDHIINTIGVLFSYNVFWVRSACSVVTFLWQSATQNNYLLNMYWKVETLNEVGLAIGISIFYPISVIRILQPRHVFQVSNIEQQWGYWKCDKSRQWRDGLSCKSQKLNCSHTPKVEANNPPAWNARKPSKYK